MKISNRLNGFFLMFQRFFPVKQHISKFIESKTAEQELSQATGLQTTGLRTTKPQAIGFCDELTSSYEIEKKQILEDIAIVQSKLEQANVVFNFQTNLDLIESTIYYIESLESRYRYLIKQARKMQLRCVLKSV